MVGLVEDALMNYENNQCTIKIFLDLSAAFDTVGQDKLVEIFVTEMGVT